jgi:hypothetical protein
MRIYDGSPRQDFEEVFRSIGAYLDGRGMQEVLLTETAEGFVVQGLVLAAGGAHSDVAGQAVKETLTLLDDDISRFMDDGLARRAARSDAAASGPGYYEDALRVIGRYIDEQRPRDVFFFEQGGSFVLRLLVSDRTGMHHVLVEFPRDEMDQLIEAGPGQRRGPGLTGPANQRS